MSTKSEARTIVYRIVFGEAKTGLGVGTPGVDSRKKPKYGETGYAQAANVLRARLPFCKFSVAKIEALQEAWDALRPREAAYEPLIASFSVVPPLGKTLTDLGFYREEIKHRTVARFYGASTAKLAALHFDKVEARLLAHAASDSAPEPGHTLFDVIEASQISLLGTMRSTKFFDPRKPELLVVSNPPA